MSRSRWPPAAAAGVTATNSGVLGSYSLCARLNQLLPLPLGLLLARTVCGARPHDHSAARGTAQVPPEAHVHMQPDYCAERVGPQPRHAGESNPPVGTDHHPRRVGADSALEELSWGHGACYDLVSDFGPAPAAGRAVAGAASAAAGVGVGAGAGVQASPAAAARLSTVSAAAASGMEAADSEPATSSVRRRRRRRGLSGSGERRNSSSNTGSGASGSGGGMSTPGGGSADGSGGGFYPVLYLAPLTGTGLQARLKNKPRVPAWWCSRSTSDWFTLWPALQSVLPPAFPCYVDNLRLEPARGGACADSADEASVWPVSPAGVEVRLSGAFGGGAAAGGGAGGRRLAATRGHDPSGAGDGGGRGGSMEVVEDLGPWGAVAARLRQLGWPAELLEVHPYDWRLNPAAWRRPGGDFARLKESIERLVAAAGGGRRVVLYGVSLGASYAAAFLDTRSPAARALGLTEEWKAEHVERLVSSSGVWEGTAHSVWDLLSGRLEGLEAVLDRGAVRRLVRGLPALAWAFPAPGITGSRNAKAETTKTTEANDAVVHRAEAVEAREGEQVVVVSNTATGRNYTAAQLGQALRDAGGDEAAAFWEAALPDMSLPPPNVTVYCFYSYGLTAPVRLAYSAADFVSDTSPAVLYGNGDVTAPYKSLAACRRWAAAQSAAVHAVSYYGIVHAQLTSVPAALDDVVAAVAVVG